MLEITVYSVFTTSFMLSILMLIFTAVTSSKKVISKLPMWTAVVFVLFIGIRLLFPFEADFNKAINSFVIMPKVKNAINYNIFTVDKGGFKITPLFITAAVWIVGSVISFYKYLKDYFLLCRISEYIPETDSQKITNILNRVKNENNFRFKTKVIMNTGVDFPCEFGIFKQTVFLNNVDYSENELYYILFHELSHFKNGSNIIDLFLNILTSVYWWNPVVKLFKKHIEVLLEIYTDRNVSVKLSEKEKTGYLKCLYNVMQNISGLKSDNAVLTPVIGGFSDNAAVNRFILIISEGKTSVPVSVFVFLVSIISILLSAQFVIQPAYKAPGEQYETITIEFTEENSYIVKEGDLYVLYYNGEPFVGSADINILKEMLEY